MQTDTAPKKQKETLYQKIKNTFFFISSVLRSKYFLIPMFGLDFAIQGGTEALIPLLAEMGVTPAYPLLVELGFAMLVGVCVYLAYKATMDYIISPALSFLGQWFSSNIYQPCCNFASWCRNRDSNVVQPEEPIAQENECVVDAAKALDKNTRSFLPSEKLAKDLSIEGEKDLPNVNPSQPSARLRHTS